ncbi:hypothetical protein AB7M49_004050 [Bradyrhizobium elkanii]
MMGRQVTKRDSDQIATAWLMNYRMRWEGNARCSDGLSREKEAAQRPDRCLLLLDAIPRSEVAKWRIILVFTISTHQIKAVSRRYDRSLPIVLPRCQDENRTTFGWRARIGCICFSLCKISPQNSNDRGHSQAESRPDFVLVIARGAWTIVSGSSYPSSLPICTEGLVRDGSDQEWFCPTALGNHLRRCLGDRRLKSWGVGAHAAPPASTATT